ncbi:sodium:proton antiporter [Mucilaginibacter daejeonensis]|uniref:cation:proton antiporter n=1 Tax=Mucilaginibacter daejeonensis TaxID=398049 RepID=UPI001D176E6C|nr:sodium:proton antiporter [Mucilaginibacter daejeonensis]UEG53347.1 sodium:proton antiporter [Mucilaginibacter daejeonensis]
MDTILIITTLFAISTVFSFINARFINLPGVIGVMVLAIVASIITVAAGSLMPGFSKLIRQLAHSVDFSKTLLDVMLGFLLFASALHFDVNKLRENLRGVLLISTVGVILSTLVFAGIMHELLDLVGMNVPFIYCLVFGALISPTDAVAVAALMTKSKMPDRLKTIISGESLFNDGIGIVLFVSFSEVASIPEKNFSFLEASKLFGQEVFGGLLLGSVLGYLTYRMMRAITDFQTIVMLTITLVLSIAAIAGIFHVSAPLAVVAAGLIIGSHSFKRDESIAEGENLERVWSLADELLNTILFVLIGLQLVSITVRADYLLIGAAAIVVLLVARMLSIILPVAFLRRTLALQYSSVAILTWGGLRGGISVALALTLPDSPYKSLILTAGFVIVVFSIVVQGLTLNRFINVLVKDRG